MMLRIRSWLRAVFRRGVLDREMRLEMREHLDLATQRYLARGMSLAEARYAARVEFGNMSVLEEQGRDARGAVWIDSIRRDVRLAGRSLRASPTFAVVAVASLAIGIGANTAIFSLIDAVVLKSLPVQRPNEIALITIKDADAPSALGSAYFTNPIWEHIRDRTASVATYAMSGNTGFNLALGGEERRVPSAWVNGEYFTTLGVRPAAGRLFVRADDYRGCPMTAVVSYGFWQSELGGRADAIGSTIHLDGYAHTVLGVTDPAFTGIDVGQATQVYVPICAVTIHFPGVNRLEARSNWWLRILARPKPGVTLAALDAGLRQASREIFAATVPPGWQGKPRANFLSSHLGATAAGNGISVVRKQYAKALIVLMGMVGIILLISCANVANLMLARGAARGREMAIRIAIGASRRRLMLQMLTESLLLAVGGAVLGLLFANWGSRFLVALFDQGGDSRIALDLGLDLRVMAFTGAVSVATVVLCGLAPAWRATRVDPQLAMKAGGRGTSDGSSRFRIGKALVVVQCALALMLVVGAGLLVGTFKRLAATDLGFRADGVIITQLRLSPAGAVAKSAAATQRRLLAEFRAIPGVRAASSADMTPVSGNTWNDFIVVAGAEGLSDDDRLAWFNSVSDGFFRTMGTPLIAGRDFGAQDVPGTPPVAIVNRTMVARFFRGASPIGKTYQTEFNGKRSPAVTIVGVVGDSKYQNLREKPQPIIYVSASQDSTRSGSTTYLLGTSGSPSAIISRVKAITARVDPTISLSFRPLSDQIASSLQRERVLATLSAFFGLVALLLAMIGLYGVMAYTVARRRVEIGIRIALGAAGGRVVRLVLGDVGRLTVLGIALGTAGAMLGTRVLGAFLFGVGATDPATIGVAAVILALAALIAGAVPARRAARLEPVEALRED